MEREGIERANAEALAARARSTNILNIPEASWAKVRAAIQNNTDIPEDATREDLLAFYHLLRAREG